MKRRVSFYTTHTLPPSKMHIYHSSTVIIVVSVLLLSPLPLPINAFQWVPSAGPNFGADNTEAFAVINNVFATPATAVGPEVEGVKYATRVLHVNYVITVPQIGHPGRPYTLAVDSHMPAHCIATDLGATSETWDSIQRKDAVYLYYHGSWMQNITSPKTNSECAAFVEMLSQNKETRDLEATMLGETPSPITEAPEGAWSINAASSMWNVWPHMTLHLVGDAAEPTTNDLKYAHVKFSVGQQLRQATARVTSVETFYGGWVRFGGSDPYLSMPRGEDTRRADATTTDLALWWVAPTCTTIACNAKGADIGICASTVQITGASSSAILTDTAKGLLSHTWTLRILPELEYTRFPPEICAALSSHGLPDPLPLRLITADNATLYISGWSDLLARNELLFTRIECSAPTGEIWTGLRTLGNTLYYSRNTTSWGSAWAQICTVNSPRPWNVMDSIAFVITFTCLVWWYQQEPTLLESHAYTAPGTAPSEQTPFTAALSQTSAKPCTKPKPLWATHALDIGPVSVPALLTEAAAILWIVGYGTWATATFAVESRIMVFMMSEKSVPSIGSYWLILFMACLVVYNLSCLVRANSIRCMWDAIAKTQISRVLARQHTSYGPATAATATPLHVVHFISSLVHRKTVKHSGTWITQKLRLLTAWDDEYVSAWSNPPIAPLVRDSGDPRWCAWLFEHRQRLPPLLFVRRLVFSSLLFITLYIILLEGTPGTIRNIIILPLAVFILYEVTRDIMYITWATAATPRMLNMFDIIASMAVATGMGYFSLFYCIYPLAVRILAGLGVTNVTIATWDFALLTILTSFVAVLEPIEARAIKSGETKAHMLMHMPPM
jgi:hypothetical protein